MQKFSYVFICFVFISFFSCKNEKTIITEPVVDNYIYNLDGEELYQSNAEKDKQKSAEQYISILYTNLYQTTLPQDQLRDLAEVRAALGDKQTADELILNAFVNNTDVTIPSNAEMRADVDKFVQETYLRFFLRKPNAYEVFELKSMINEDDDLTPDLIYQGFALSNEYKFY